MNPKHYNVRVLADSINEQMNRLTTFELTYPRFIHAEFMTHRMLSRNAASSRAIPTRKLIEMVEEEPLYPLNFGLNCKGMVSRACIPESVKSSCDNYWFEGAQRAVETARELLNVKDEWEQSYQVHKQHVNRVLEPYLPITVIASATEWENFIYLRDSDQAQPEIAWVAREIRRELEASVPTIAELGEWHCPLTSDDPDDELYADLAYTETNLAEISAARCARVSYLTHDGERSIREDKRLFDSLVENGHWSPLEHVAMCMVTDTRWGNFFGWKQLRKCYDDEHQGRNLE